MKKVFKYTVPALMLCLMASCSDDDTTSAGGGNSIVDPNSGKEVIAFSGEGDVLTRASLTRAGFDQNTKIVARIKAQNGTTSDYRYTQTVLIAGSSTTSDDDCNTKYGLGTGITHSHLTYKDGKTRYWDDAFGRTSKLTVYAVAVPNNTDIADNPETTDVNEAVTAKLNDNALDQTDTNLNWYTIDTENTLFNWNVSTKQNSSTRKVEDLSYSNNISEDATAKKNKGRYHQTWDTSKDPDKWVYTMEEGRLGWQPQFTTPTESTTGKFDMGHLVFKHALAWIEINLKEGAGFNNSSKEDFTWTNKPSETAQTISLIGFYTGGKLNLSTGVWSENDYSTADITQLDETTGTPDNKTTRTLHGYIVPGNNLYTTGTNVIEFEIDNAKYYVTGTQIANAIRDYYRVADTENGITAGLGVSDPNADEYRSFTVTKPGKHYIINLTVSKKGVDNITAAILDWETVNSTDAKAKNTYCTFEFEDRDTKLTESESSQFDIYRAAKPATDFITGSTTANYEWGTGYTEFESPKYSQSKANKTWSTNHWTTDWYWEDNKTYYHFRAAGTGKSASGDAGVTAEATNGDYFPIKAGAKGSSDYKDFVWGAPFKQKDNAYKIVYTSANGFDNNQTFGTGSNAETVSQISQAIGATDSQIKMLLFHMTSQIQVNVKTTTDNSEVVLYKAAVAADTDKGIEAQEEKKTVVEILNFLPNGKVRMGTGKVEADAITTEIPRTGQATMTYGTYTAKEGTTAAHINGYKFGMIPQTLTWTDTDPSDNTKTTSGTIGLRITTPDGNQYVVKDLSTCKGTVSETNLKIPYTGSEGNYNITEWFPNYRYTYTVTIKKTGISNITAAVVPWEEVKGDLGTIDLEN